MAVRRAQELGEARQRLVRSQLEMLCGYAETTACRRAALLGYFGERAADRCDHCDNCDRGTTGPAPPAVDTGFVPHERVRHPEWGDGAVMQLGHDRLTVLFDLHGYKTLDLAVLRDNDLLSPVGGAATPGVWCADRG